MAIRNVTGGGSALQTAINSAAANDILLVDDGVYSPITCNKTLTISSLHGYENCIIDGSGVKRCATRTGNQPKIYGFTCRNGYTISGDGQTQAGDCGGIFNFYTVQDCAIYDCSCSKNTAALTIQANGSATRCLISGCYADNYVICAGNSLKRSYLSYLSVLNNSVGGANTNNGSIMFQCSDIDNCIFDGNQGSTKSTGIVHPNTSSLKPIVSNCVFRNNKTRGGSATYIIADAQVDNCVFYNNGTSSLKFRSCVQDCGIKNCTFYGNRVNYGDVIRTRRQGNSYIIPLNYIDNSVFTKLDVRGNIYANNQIVQVRNCRFNNYYIDNNNLSVTTFTDCTSGVAIDTAQFVNASSRNFHLLGTSPCISAGNYSLVPDSKRDLDGKLYRNPPSIGCYKFYELPYQCIPNDVIPFGNELTYVRSYESEILDYLMGTKRIYVPTSIQQKLRSLHMGAFYHVGITNNKLNIPNLTRMDGGIFSVNGTPNLRILKIPNITVMTGYTYYPNASGKTFDLIDVSNVQTIQKNFVRYATVKYWYFGNRTRTDLPAFASGVTLAVGNADSGLAITANVTKIVLPDEMYDTWISTSPWSGIASSYYMTKTEFDALGLNY